MHLIDRPFLLFAPCRETGGGWADFCGAFHRLEFASGAGAAAMREINAVSWHVVDARTLQIVAVGNIPPPRPLTEEEIAALPALQQIAAREGMRASKDITKNLMEQNPWIATGGSKTLPPPTGAPS